MAVDRGGLRYTIEVKDAFSEGLRRFIEQAREAKAAWSGLKKDLEAVGKASERMSKAQREAAKSTQLSAKAAEASASAEERRSRAFEQSHAAQQRAHQSARRLHDTYDDLAGTAERKVNSSRRASVAASQESQAQSRAGNLADRARAAYERLLRAKRLLAVRATRLARALREQGRELIRIDNHANRVAFTFRRLFGIFAAFAAVRLAIQGFNSLLRSAIQFNSELEQINLGIAALFTATGDVRNALGETVGPAQSLAEAQKEAARQTQLLRIDALRTKATFTDLAQAFQVGVGPGLTAGLNVDEIRQFTVRISQAAASIGLEQRQLAEEIRSILSGTIQVRQTRIAAVLNIDNNDIRRWKEAGTLFENLQNRFEAFGVAGEKTLGTFDAIFTNTKDAIIQLIGTGAVGFFTEIKNLLNDIQNSTRTQIGDQLIINPKAQKVIETISDGLRSAVSSARSLVNALTFDEALRIATLMRDAISTAGRAGTAAFRGFLKAVSNIGKVVGRFSTELGEAFRLVSEDPTNAGWERLVELAAKFATEWGAVIVALSAVSGLIRLIRLPLVLIGSAIGAMAPAINTVYQLFVRILPLVRQLRGVSTLWLAALAAVVIAVGEMAAELGIMDYKFGTLVKVVGVALVNAIRFAAGLFRALFTTAIVAVKNNLRLFIHASREAIIGLAQAVVFIVNKTTNTLGDLRKRLEDIQSRGRKSFLENTVKDAERVRDVWAEFGTTAKKVGASFTAGFTDAILEDKTTRTLQQVVDDAFKTAKGSFAKGLAEEAEDAVKGSQSLLELFSKLPAIVQRSSDALTKQGDILKVLREQVEKSQDALDFTKAADGVSGGVRQQLEELFKAETQARDRTRSIVADIKRTEEQILRLSKERSFVAARIDGFNTAEQNAVNVLAARGKELVANEREFYAIRQQVKALEGQVAIAKTRGAQEEIDASQKALDAANNRLTANRRAAESIAKAFRNIEDGIRGSANFDQIVKSATQLLSLTGQEKAAKDLLKQLEEGRLRIAKDLNREAANRVQILARQQSAQIDLSNQILRVEAAEAVRVASAQRSGILIRQQVAEQRASLNIAVRQAEIAQAQRRDELRTAEKVLAGLKQKNADTAAIAEQERLLGLLRDQNALALVKESAQLAQIAEDLRRLELVNSGTFTQGLKQGLLDFANEYQSIFTEAAEFMGGALQGAIDTAADAFTDSLDPEADVDLRERFARFFQAIANDLTKRAIGYLVGQLIQFFTVRESTDAKTVAAASALSGASASLTTSAALWLKTAAAIQFAADTLLLANSTSGGIPGLAPLARGGQVPAHLHPGVNHFATGGAVPWRPKGVPASDTIPAWLTPGEWVVRLNSVRKYGSEFMDMVNRGLIDPSLARGLAATARGGKLPHRSRGMGYATGGPVSGPSIQRESGQNQSGPVILPVMVTDTQEVERLAGSMRGSILRDMRDNQDEFRSALGLNS